MRIQPLGKDAFLEAMLLGPIQKNIGFLTCREDCGVDVQCEDCGEEEM